jgi:hypothetical protein
MYGAPPRQHADVANSGDVLAAQPDCGLRFAKKPRVHLRPPPASGDRILIASSSPR